MFSARRPSTFNPFQWLLIASYYRGLNAMFINWEEVVANTEYLFILAMHELSDGEECHSPAMACERLSSLRARTEAVRDLLSRIDADPSTALRLVPALPVRDRMEICRSWRRALRMKREQDEASIFIRAAYGALAETASRPVAPFAVLESEMTSGTFADYLERGADGLSIYHAAIMRDCLDADSFEEVECELARTSEQLEGPIHLLARLAAAPYDLRELLVEVWPSNYPMPTLSAHEALACGRRWELAGS
jgi:hypothetical protein